MDEPPATAASVAPARSVVFAFMNICGTFEQAHMDRQARHYGFVPVQTSRLPPDVAATLRQVGDATYIRAVPDSNVRALVTWNSEASRCTFLVGGVDPAEVEREFVSLTERLGTGALAIQRITPEQVAQINQRGRPSTQLRQGVVLGPRPPAMGRRASISMAIHSGPDVALPVSLIYGPYLEAPLPPGPPGGASRPTASPLRI
ncbi:hypothetical protein J4558_12795 [Leptolyngbya sp. 15MV]|nr:hypothetical protein J4558_12795 [Leptolyngbya sp. 15MV]